MQNIGQNWIWILIIVAFVAFHLFGHGHRRHGGSGDDGHRHGGLEGVGGFEHGGIGGFGHDGVGRHGHDHRDDENRTRPGSPQPVEAVIDPVSGSAVPTAGAITSAYQGKAYYFASKENRDRFEAAPEEFTGKVQGVPIGGSENIDRPRHRHHGC